MDMEALMAQASALQDKVAAAQDRLAQIHVKGISEDGACIIDMSGKYDLFDIKIREDIIARGAEGVAAVVAAAYKDAKAKADEIIDQVMCEATAGIPMSE